MSKVVLSLRDFSVRFGPRTILTAIDLDVGSREILTLMGPGGAGKSTLLRTICGFNDGHRDLHVGGMVRYLGRPLDAGRPVLVEQSLPVMMSTVITVLARAHPDRPDHTRRQLRLRLREQLALMGAACLVPDFDRPVLELSPARRRLLAICACLLSEPPLLCVDEPTAGLDRREAAPILKLLAAQKEHRAILMATHHQGRAQELGTYTALLAGGTIYEHRRTEEFFGNPRSELTQSFIRTGSCTVASPDAAPEELEPTYRQHRPRPQHQTPPQRPSVHTATAAVATRRAAPSANRGPIGFHWMRPGQLAGTPLPGAFRSLKDDIQALKRVEITRLITLTLQPLPEQQVRDLGLAVVHFPIIDMDVPTLADAARLCERVESWLADGDAIAFHCKAGIGRTGTMLAIFEIWQGKSAEQAFAAARQVHNRWIQSARQRRFLDEFEQFIHQFERSLE